MFKTKYFARLAIVVLSVAVISIFAGKALASTPTFSFNGTLGQPNNTNSGAQGSIGVTGSGFDSPFAVEIDTVRHRMFTVDQDNNRVLVFNLDGDNLLADKTADYVLGQADMTQHLCNRDEATTANTLCSPEDAALDETTGVLYVADSDNHRVLGYDTTELSSGMNATLVLGQTDFSAGDYFSEPTTSSLANPTALAVDSVHGRLFVGDYQRVAIFSTSELGNNDPATNFIGQANGTTMAYDCSPVDNRFCYYIGGLGYDSSADKLYVSDSANYRVLQFDTSAISDGEAAEHVLGQAALDAKVYLAANQSNISDARAIDIDTINHRLYVSDAGFSGANRVMVFDISIVTDGEDAINELGQADFSGFWQNRVDNNSNQHASSNTLSGPYGLAYNKSSGQLFVADSWNNRVMIYDPYGYEDGEDAVDQIGQPTFMGTGENAQSVGQNGFNFPSVTEFDTVHHRLFVADYQNERVLVYNLNDDNELVDETADNVLGQSSFTSIDMGACPWVGGVPNQHSLCFGEGIFGGLAYDSVNDRLFVTDGASSRIMIFDTASITNGEDAVGMIGQDDWDNGDCNSGTGTSAATLCLAGNIALDAEKHVLYAVDTNNNRVLQYTLDADNLPDDLGLEANAVIGQPNMSQTDVNADAGEIVPNGLRVPNGITLDRVNHHLYVADTGNNRILGFSLDEDNIPTQLENQEATTVLGQPDVYQDDCNNAELEGGAQYICFANGVTLDSTNHRLYVADSGNHRVVMFNLSNTNAINDKTADAVVGQADFDSFSGNRGGNAGAETLNNPWGITLNSATNQLFIADNNNNRIVIYDSETPSDVDGVDAGTEDAAPNDGDGNNDGTVDSGQSNVVSVTNPATDKYFTVETSCNSLESVQIGTEAGGASNDAAYNYPAGLAAFHANCQTSGETATMTMYFYGTFDPANFILRKWQDDVYKTLPGAVFSNVTIGGQAALKVVYQITDGGEFDNDGAANGVIVDPVGPAQNIVGTPNTGLGRLSH